MFGYANFQIAFTLPALIYLIFMASRLLWRVVSRCKNTVLLPTIRGNNFLFYLTWIVPVIRSDGLYKDFVILRMIPPLAFRFKKRGLVHGRLPFLDVVLLFHPNTVQPLLQSPSNVDKPMFYSFFEEWLGPSIFFSDRSTWQKRRKLLTPAFHLEILQSSLLVFEKQSKILVDTLAREGASGAIDAVPLITDCVTNTICETAMGIDTTEWSDKISSLGKHLAILLDIVYARMFKVWWWPNVIFRFTENGRQYQRSLKTIKEIADQVIQERISQAKNSKQEKIPEVRSTKQQAFLDILLSSLSNDSGLSLDDIRKEVQFFLFAGHDTSALTLIWALYLLGHNPDVQIKLQKEVDEMLGDDPDRLLSKQDLYSLKYTECVIKETLRLYPVAPLIARKTCEDLSIGEYKIPKGFNCVISIPDIHRDPDIFPCPDKFDPERFLPENSLDRHPYAFIPFSAGPRNCLGQKFAMLEMKVILARVMQKFTLESIDQTMDVKYRITLHPGRPVRLHVKKR